MNGLLALANVVVIIFLIGTKEHMKSPDKRKSMGGMRWIFWIVLLVNMASLAIYIVERWWGA